MNIYANIAAHLSIGANTNSQQKLVSLSFLPVSCG